MRLTWSRRYFHVVICVFACLGWMRLAHAADPVKPGAEQAQPATTGSQQVSSIQIPEKAFDFGEAMEGAEITHVFPVKNAGAAPLQINQVRPSCGCTLAHFDPTIAPGAEGKITLKLNLKGYQGEVKKTATVYSNDPQNPRLILSLHGKVKSIIGIRPTSVVSFRGLADQLHENVLELESTPPQKFHIEKTESNLEGKAAYELETVQDGTNYKLKITNVLKQGNYSGFIKLFTDVPQKPELVIRVTGFIEGDISVKPQTLVIGKLAAQQPVRVGKVLVTNNRGKPFKVTKLTYDEDVIHVAQQSLPGEPGYTLEVSANLDHVDVNSRKQTVLTIETDASPSDKYEVHVHVLNAGNASPAAAAMPGPAGQGPTKTPGGMISPGEQLGGQGPTKQ